MKKLLALGTFFLIAESGFAQSAFKQGQLDIQAGIGFINTISKGLNDAVGSAATAKFTSPPPIAAVEYGITDELSIGGYISYAAMDLRHANGDLIENDKITFAGIRGMYHFPVHPSFDTYGGLGFAYGSVVATQPGVFGGPDQKQTESNVYYQLTAGIRYRLAKPIGPFLEVGYGVTVVNIGLNLKF